MRQSAYLVVNSITVYSYGIPFNCMVVGQASDSVTEISSVGSCMMVVLAGTTLAQGFL